jgi:predicted dehydrogenase
VLRKWVPHILDEIGWDKPLTAADIAPPYHDPYQAQLRHFQRLIRLDEAPMVSVTDGANTLAATLAVAQSSSQGRPCAPVQFAS